MRTATNANISAMKGNLYCMKDNESQVIHHSNCIVQSLNIGKVGRFYPENVLIISITKLQMRVVVDTIVPLIF